MTDAPAASVLIDAQARTLFVHDARDRLVCVNEPGQPPAPRFFFGRTAGGNIWRLRHDIAAPLAGEIVALAAAEPVVSDMGASFARLDHIRNLLAREAPPANEYCGPAYRFPGVSLNVHADVTIMRTPEEAAPLAAHWGVTAVEPAWLPAAGVLDAGRIVSACFCARRSAVAAEAGLETAPAFRRRGYALRVVTAWASVVADEGLTPLYSTSWDNEASQGVARRLGLVMYGVDLHIS